jgi:hypothetical protein
MVWRRDLTFYRSSFCLAPDDPIHPLLRLERPIVAPPAEPDKMASSRRSSEKAPSFLSGFLRIVIGILLSWIEVPFTISTTSQGRPDIDQQL